MHKRQGGTVLYSGEALNQIVMYYFVHDEAIFGKCTATSDTVRAHSLLNYDYQKFFRR